jgi:hypothetical protein
MRDPDTVRGFVDGGWWPRSLDLASELPDVLIALFATGFDARRVMYNISAWDEPPRSIMVQQRLVKLGGFRTQDPALIGLVDTSHWNTAHYRRIELVVIPPGTEPAAAERSLALAGRDRDGHTAQEILECGRRDPGHPNRMGCIEP